MTSKVENFNKINYKNPSDNFSVNQSGELIPKIEYLMNELSRMMCSLENGQDL